MRVLPVGISASNLSVFWPLWDAALLRRYGRTQPTISDNLVTALVTAWLRSRRPTTRRPLTCPPPGFHLLPPLAGLPLPGQQLPPALEAALPPLELHWPSDDPPVPPQIIVVERWLREPPPLTGDLLDVLY